MTDQSKRQYLDDVPKELQDLIYDKRIPEAIKLLVAQKGLGKVQATTEVGRVLSRMKEQFPEDMDDEDPTGAEAISSPRMKSVILWVVILFFIGGGAAATFFGVSGVLRAKASAGWPTVQGEIIESSVERETRRRKTGDKGPLTQTIYRARISYEYTVDGTTFTGTRVAYGDHGKIANSRRIGIGGSRISIGGSAKAHAQGIVALYPKGNNVSVYYMPENPKECLLEPGLALKAFGWPAAGVLLLIIGGVITWAAIAGARDKQ